MPLGARKGVGNERKEEKEGRSKGHVEEERERKEREGSGGGSERVRGEQGLKQETAKRGSAMGSAAAPWRATDSLISAMATTRAPKSQLAMGPTASYAMSIAKVCPKCCFLRTLASTPKYAKSMPRPTQPLPRKPALSEM